MNAALTRSNLWIGAQITTFLLLVVWQIPGTIGLRYGLLGLLIPIVVVLCYWRTPINQALLINRSPIIWLLVLTGWLMLVIMLWAVEPALSWKEFRGQWLTALGAGLAGGFLARAASKDSPGRRIALLRSIFWALLAQVLLHDILGAIYWASTGNLPFRQAPVLYLPEFFRALSESTPILDGFTGTSPDKFSYVNNTLAALLVAELVQRLLLRKSWLGCSHWLLSGAILAVLLCSYWLQMRNGNVGLLLLLAMTALMLAIRLLPRLGAVRVLLGVVIVIATLAALAQAMVHSDARWQKLTQTIPVALDTESHRVWLTRDSNYPLMASGDVVDLSAYDRLAWGKEGFKLILDHPLGTGYNRNAYGDGIDRKYEQHGNARGGHAHSGVIDFTIANGAVGLVLWLGFIASLFYVGWQTFRGEQVGLGLVLMFLVSGFMGRSIVDSNIRDHVLQQFFFLAMLFYGLTASTRGRSPT